MPLNRPRARQLGSATTTVVICFLLIAAAVAVYYAATTRGNGVMGPQTQREQEMLGLNSGVANRLADRFADADGDLIADPPHAVRTPDTLRVTYLSEAEGVAPEQITTLAEALASATGVPAEPVAFSDSDEALLALSAGELDVVGFNTGNVPRAVNAAGFVPVAAPASQGQPAEYRMVVAVPAASDIQTLADLAGRTVAFTRPGSNSGYKAPLVLLIEQAGLTPPLDYRWTFSLSHQASIAGLAKGTYDVIATASDLLDAAVEEGTIAADAFRVIYESEAFPVAAIGYAHDLDPALAEPIAEALLAFEPTGPAADAFVGADGMQPVDFKDDFALIRKIDDDAGFEHTLPPAAEPEAEQPAETPA